MKDNNMRLTEYEMLCQLNDLISDRASLLTDNKENDSTFLKDIKAIRQIIYDYKILKEMALDDMNPKNHIDFIWIKEKLERKKVEIVNFCDIGYREIIANIKLYKNKKQIGDFVVSYDRSELDSMSSYLRIKLNIDNVTFETCIKALAYKSFDKLSHMPKITKCSKILQMIYMHTLLSKTYETIIDEKILGVKLGSQYIEKLKKEIKKYNLEDVININEDDGLKITTYRILEGRFNDDLKIERKKDYER